MIPSYCSFCDALAHMGIDEQSCHLVNFRKRDQTKTFGVCEKILRTEFETSNATIRVLSGLQYWVVSTSELKNESLGDDTHTFPFPTESRTHFFLNRSVYITLLFFICVSF